MHALFHRAVDCLVSGGLPALGNVQGAGQTCSSRDSLPHGLRFFAFAAGSDAQISV